MMTKGASLRENNGLHPLHVVESLKGGEPGSGERVLYERRSPFQHILLEEDTRGALSLTIDGHWQFSSIDEAIFHEMLADLPMVFAPSTKRVLILGGGDALALRHVLRYEGVEHVTLCELDPAMLEMVRTIPQMRDLTQRALEDKRVEVCTRDAWDFVHEFSVAKAGPCFDVVICDFPACTDAKLARLFSAGFYRKLKELMSIDGLVCVQVSQDPPAFWDIVQGGLAPNFEFIWPSLVALGDPADADTEWADFVLVSCRELRKRRPLAVSAKRFLEDEVIDAYRIKNRSRVRFETEMYGDEPDFSEPW